MNDIAALMRAINKLTERVNKLEAQNRFTIATDWMPGNWWGRVSPTQPPSRAVHIHGGLMWWFETNSGMGYYRWLSDTVFDFSTSSPWTAAGYYRWTVLQADVAAQEVPIWLWESPEFGTWEEAEIDFRTNGLNEDLYGNYIPLAVVVLQNNGNTGVAGAVKNITLADKDQSYFLVRDFRPWLHVHTAGGPG